MSRDGRDVEVRATDGNDRPHDPSLREDRTHHRDPAWSPARALTLPHARDRQPVALGRTRYHLRDSETQLLSVVGSFRVIPDAELRRDREQGHDVTAAQNQAGDVRSLM